VVLAAVLAASWSGDGPGAAPKVDEKSVPRWEELIAALWKAHPWGGCEQDKEITLAKMLDEIAKNLRWRGVSFYINEKAFKAENISPDFAIVAEKEITGGTETLAMVLKKILERVEGKSGVTYLVRRDVIEITTIAAAREEVWGKGHPGPFLPLVHAAFKERPLNAALQELADQADRNVLLDGRVAAKGKTLVTARFRNLPLDTAVDLLAREADLHTVPIAGGLYVTTKAEAEAIAKRQDEKRNAAAAKERKHGLFELILRGKGRPKKDRATPKQ